MAHESRIGRLLWAGRYHKAIALQTERYERNPKGATVPLASALYSGRMKPQYRTQLIAFTKEVLYTYALNFSFHSRQMASAVDEADVISTIFVWAAAQPEVEQATRDNLLNVASMLVQEALHMTAVHPCSPHSEPLLLLTRATINLLGDETARAPAINDLFTAKNLAASIPDRYQRERVLRKVGILLRANGRKREGLLSLVSALLVNHRAFGVKAKTLAALLGAAV